MNATNDVKEVPVIFYACKHSGGHLHAKKDFAIRCNARTKYLNKKFGRNDGNDFDAFELLPGRIRNLLRWNKMQYVEDVVFASSMHGIRGIGESGWKTVSVWLQICGYKTPEDFRSVWAVV